MIKIVRPLKTRRNLAIVNAERDSLGLPPSHSWSAEKNDDIIVGIDVDQLVSGVQ